MSSLRSACSRLNELEKDLEHNIGDIRSIYDALLIKFPALEGFWIRWAHTEFRYNSNWDESRRIYKRALKKLPYSLLIWVDYLKFMTQLAPGSHDEQINDGSMELVGDHFWSHEYWDWFLKKTPDKIQWLIVILEEKTIHQFTKYYAELIDLLEKAETEIEMSPFQRYLPEVNFNLVDEEIQSDELSRYKEVIRSKLKLRYDLHSARVTVAMEYERRIKRPFFYPDGNTRELDVWLDYAKNSNEPTKILQRALIPFYDDVKLWIQYTRLLISSNCFGPLDYVFTETDFPEIKERARLWHSRMLEDKSDEHSSSHRIYSEKPRSSSEVIEQRLRSSPYAKYIY